MRAIWMKSEGMSDDCSRYESRTGRYQGLEFRVEFRFRTWPVTGATIGPLQGNEGYEI